VATRPKFSVQILGRPLSDSKTLKDKFDQIFDATRYTHTHTHTHTHIYIYIYDYFQKNEDIDCF
jgi:hypothetical protein